jgi:diacylglycerol kinase (ATP)
VARRATLIANPVAGSDEAGERLHLLQSRLERAGPVRTVLTGGPGDATRAARDAALRGDDVVFVAGGDGTLNESLNGLASVGGALDRIGVGLVPMGTGNDFARALGMPDDLEAALDVLERGVVRQVDLGRVNGRLFVNASAGGFLAEVSEAVDPALKSVAGRLAYLVGGAKVLLGATPFRLRAAHIDRECLLFAVCNAPMIGGGRLIAPSAVIDDGRLDVCVVQAMDLVTFVALLTRVSSGTHTDVDGVEYFSTDGLSLEFDRRVAVNVDGEVFEADRVDYDVQPRAVRFLAPRPQ